MARAFGSVGKYIQKRGEIANLAAHTRLLGQQIIALISPGTYRRMQPQLDAGFEGVSVTFDFFQGECTREEIDRVAEAARTVGADVLVAIGGGKAIDTAKAAAVEIGARIVVVPTIASSDAPCSAIAIVYSEEGVQEKVLAFPRNPDLVLVDPDVIIAAPVRFLVAGMGDAFSTWYEARSSSESRSDNIVGAGYPPTLAGMEIANLCDRILTRDALSAKIAAEKGLCTGAVENIIEVNILLSGLGFENCGCSAAHAIHDALTRIDETHDLLHGEKVAFGTLCLLTIENRAPCEIEAAIRFCRSIGLPTTLADLHIREDVEAKVTRIAETTLAVPGGMMYRTPRELSLPLVRDAILALDALSRSLT